MSVPNIPGYTGASDGHTLASFWPKPSGEFPDELWPSAVLRSINSEPSGWVTVEAHEQNDRITSGIHSILATPEGLERSLKQTSWSGRDLGDIGVYDNGRFEDGLQAYRDDDHAYSFFCDIKRHHGLSRPTVEISAPFLWFWDAIPTATGWIYLDDAGRDVELIRTSVEEDAERVEIRALELQSFLWSAGQYLVVQRDSTLKASTPPFERVDSEWKTNWANFTMCIVPASDWSADHSFSNLMGKSVINPKRTVKLPRFLSRDRPEEYAEFIYASDPKSGSYLKHTCDPKALGTYFDEDNSRLHYLTPVYFDRKVLQRYASDTKKYRVTGSRLSCLNLWGLDIGINTANLVEVYLGDLGEKLPSQEWPYWLSHNIPPEGKMEEGRFRRDFLGQFASSPDPMRDLRRARARTSDASLALLGAPIFRELKANDAAEFEALVGPLGDSASELNTSVLVLVKAMVDGIDSSALKKHLEDGPGDEKSLALLRRLLDELGDSNDIISVFTALQNYRSAGGVAHLSGSQTSRAAARLGIDGLSPYASFVSIVERLTAATDAIALLFDAAASEPDEG